MAKEITRKLGLYLISKGFATGFGNTLFLETSPDKPDNLVSIFSTGGYPPELSIPELRRTAQIMVRSQNYASGHGLIWDIFSTLDNPENRVFDLAGVKTRIRAMNSPVLLKWDETGRAYFVFNVELTTSRS